MKECHDMAIVRYLTRQEMAKLVGTRLVIDGFTYTKSRQRGNRIYWDCEKVRARECTARAVTQSIKRPLDPIVVLSGPATSKHGHPANHDAVKAKALLEEVKKVAEEQPALPPAVIVRDALATAPGRVLSQLPLRNNIRQTICRVRRKNLPEKPNSIEDLEDLPDEYTKTSLGEQFVLHDNRHTKDEDEGRVIVFGTRKNIEILCRSPIWFLDGTFKMSPTLFTQIFTIIGIRTRRIADGEDTPLPFVYALLEGKHEAEYAEVLQVVKDAVARYRINACVPLKMMTDFEKAIHNACATVYPGVQVRGCFFHLGQAVYRKVQALGLQSRYNDPDDESIRNYSHMLLALAYLPPSEVPRMFRELYDDSPDELDELYQYFNEIYVNGVPARGRRRAVAPRYTPITWNQYDTVIANSHKTNNVSEGWHNRFRTMVGKPHPDIFKFIDEIKKEQGNTEVSLVELSLGRRVKNIPARRWYDYQQRIRTIVLEYNDYVNDDNELEYIRNLATTIEIS